MDEQRFPKTLQGLIKFCMTVGDDYSSTVAPMDPERRQWLKEALESMTVDIIKVLKENIRILLSQDHDHSSQAEKEKFEALSSIHSIVDDMDFANDFIKIGGLNLLLHLIRNPDSTYPIEIRELACDCLATCCQNNPFAQHEAMRVQSISILLTELQRPEQPLSLVRKLLYSLSGIIRALPEAAQLFEKSGGVPILMAIFQRHSDPGLLTKVTFLLKSLCADEERILLSSGDVRTVCQALTLNDAAHEAHHEHLLALLLQVAQSSAGLQTLKDVAQSTALVPSLRARVLNLNGQEEHLESLQYATELLEKLGDI